MSRDLTQEQLERIAERSARRYKLNPRLFKMQIGAESAWDQNAGSPKGARGVAQIMPDTARGWGVDPLKPRQALDAAAKNMARYVEQFGSIEDALRAYNAGPGAVEASKGYAETNNYVSKIMGGYKDLDLLTGGGSGSSRGSGARPAVPGAMTLERGKETFDVQDADLRRQQFFAQWMQRTNPNSPLLKLGLLDPRMKTTSQVTLPTVTGFKQAPGQNARPGKRQPSGSGKVTVNPGANRDGVGLSKSLMNALDHLSSQFGPIVVGTGTNHSQMTTSGNVSDHWDGHGADIPAVGDRLTKMGRAALRAYGMSEAEAKKAGGGIYNLTWRGKRVQVIFNTQQGGNHFNHLHVGVR